MNYNKVLLIIIGSSISSVSNATNYINDDLSENFHKFNYSARHRSKNNSKVPNTMSQNIIGSEIIGVAQGLSTTGRIDMFDIASRLLDPKQILNFGLRYYDVGIPYWVARTDFNIEVQKDKKLTWDIETIQPLYQTNSTKRNTAFIQVRWGHTASDDTVNIGFGYRGLVPDESWLFGANIFYDTTLKAYHKRIGLGGEIIGRFITLRTNYYKAISSERTLRIENGIHTTEKALDGYDIGFELPVPKLPWMHIRFDHYKWIADKLSDVHGYALRIHCNISKYARLEIGRSEDTGNTSTSRWFAKVSLNIGTNPSYEYNAYDNLVSDTILVGKDLYNHTLDKVKRHHDIVVERRYGNSNGIIIGRGT